MPRKALAFQYFYDPETGEGYPVKFSDEFQHENALMHSDVLGDAVAALTDEYNGSLGVMDASFDKMRSRAQKKEM